GAGSGGASGGAVGARRGARHRRAVPRFPVEARDARRSHPGGGAVGERGGAPRAAARRGGAASLGAAAARVRAAAGGTLTPRDAGDRRAGDLAAGGSRGAVGRGEGHFLLKIVLCVVTVFYIVCVLYVMSIVDHAQG